MTYTRVVRARLDEETFVALLRATNRRGGNISEYVREAIQDKLKSDKGYTKEELTLIEARYSLRQETERLSVFRQLVEKWRDAGSSILLSKLLLMCNQFPYLILPEDISDYVEESRGTEIQPSH